MISELLGANFHPAGPRRAQRPLPKLIAKFASWSRVGASRGLPAQPRPAALSSPPLPLAVLQTVLIHQILRQTESATRSVWVGVGLCVTLFVTEFTKVLFWALAWAINYRTAIRLKVALSTLVFENLVSFKTLTRISVGEVSRPAAGAAS